MRTNLEKSPLELWPVRPRSSILRELNRGKTDGCRNEENTGNASWRQRHWLRVLGIETPIRQGWINGGEFLFGEIKINQPCQSKLIAPLYIMHLHLQPCR